MAVLGRAVWALYAVLPLIFIPAGVGTFHALRETSEGSMRVAMHFATLAALSMMWMIVFGVVLLRYQPQAARGTQ